MKKFLIFGFLFLVVLVVLAKLGIIDTGAPPPEPVKRTRKAPTKRPPEMRSSTTQKPAPREEKGAVQSVMEYGVGYTQFKAKQHSKKKLDKITTGHNKDIEKH
ncbi:MAG: hypothetical protein HN742_09810 [Lentisphaerae bacterium]|mgnify:CR=1 FL=1|nr:hypothetical protein [Lentisphaerota bacterium]MBT4823145.1 hypothetical protein [Lentisphaerota bacterium]MBT5610467.1 hypothetical protein [Lentisphaerota bacterium]MBT7061058.1 hypothetical protein [Lentisphaerota bacterium]MBT7842157.1 hypothetical protein [Lentisphaerota bacterium]